MNDVAVKISVAGIHNEGYTAATFQSKLGELSGFSTRGFSDSLATKSGIDMLASDYGGRMGYRSTTKYHLSNSNLVVFFVEATELAMTQAKQQLHTFVNDRMVRARIGKNGPQPLLVLAQRALTGSSLTQEAVAEKLNLPLVAGGRPFRVQIVPRPDIKKSIASEPTRATSAPDGKDFPQETQKALAEALDWAQTTLTAGFLQAAEQAIAANASLDNPAKQPTAPVAPQQPLDYMPYDQQLPFNVPFLSQEQQFMQPQQFQAPQQFQVPQQFQAPQQPQPKKGRSLFSSLFSQQAQQNQF